MILTDSSSDLTYEELDQYKIGSIPIYVRFKDEIYHDKINITTEEMHDKIKEKNEIPEVGTIRMTDFISFFQTYLDKGYDVIYIGMSSHLSKTFFAATLAREELDLKNRLYLIDSNNVSSGLALLVLKAKDLRDQGLKASLIKEEIEKIIPNIRSHYMLSSREYFDQNFSENFFKKMIAKIFRQKMIISVRFGKYYIYKRPKNNLMIISALLLKEFYKDLENIDLDYCFITHHLCHRQVIFLTNQINKYADFHSFQEVELGCVISSVTGPHTVGIIYALKN